MPLNFFLSEDTVINKEVEINDRITDPEIRVIDENGQQLGIMSAQEANRIADEKNLDLVKINPGGNPPVCKIMDYGKFKLTPPKGKKTRVKTKK